MSQTTDRLTQLEEEIRDLKSQLEQTQGDFLHTKTLSALFFHNREVVFYDLNDEKHTVVAMSDSISAYGYSPEDFLSGRIGWREVIHPDDRQTVAGCIAGQEANVAASTEHEYRILTKSGKYVWIACVSVPEFGVDGKVTRFLVKIKDISQRKQYEEELQAVNENLLVTLKSIGEAVILTDAGGRIDRLNGAAEKFLGIINLKAKNKPLSEVMQLSFTPDFATVIDPLKMKAETCKMVQCDEIFMKCGNNKLCRVSCNVSPIFEGRDKTAPKGYVLVVKDLTSIYDTLQAAQKSKARMQESESTIRGIFDHSADGMLLADQEGTVKEWSSGYERMSGIPKEEAIGKKLWEIAWIGLPPEFQNDGERERLKDELTTVLSEMKQRMIVRQMVKRETGERHVLNVLYFPVAMPGRMMLGAISRDVTEEVNALELNRQNELRLIAEKERLQALDDNFPDGCLFRFIRNEQTIQMKFTYLSRTWETLTGMPVEEALADFNNALANVHPDDLPVFAQSVEESATTLKNFNFEFRFLQDDGYTLWLQASSSPKPDGDIIVWDGFIVNITERKLAEQKLAAKALELVAEKGRLEALGNNLPDGSLYRFVHDQGSDKMKMEYVSATWETVTGVPAEKVLEDISSLFEHMHPDDVAETLRLTNETAESFQKFNVEVRITVHGQPRWLQITSRPYRENGKVIWDGILQDITHRKEIEREVIAERDRLEALGNNLPDGCLYRFNLETTTGAMGISYVSNNWEAVTGLTSGVALSDINAVFGAIYPNDLPMVQQAIQESAQTLNNFNIETRIHYKGRIRWVQMASHPHIEGTTINWDGIILDITERKKAEQELTVYREELERLVKERTEELEATNEELYATNEELYATNEEFAVTNEELHTKNDQLRHEITARKEIMQKLEDSESKVRNFIQQSFEGIMFLDNEGRVVEWNESLEQLTNLPHAKAVGEYEWDLLKNYLPEEMKTPEAFGKLRQSRLDYINGGRDQKAMVEELVLNMPDGNQHYLQISMFPIGMAETCFFSRVLRDVTDKKRADMELEQYRTQLEQMVETKTRELFASQERLVSLSNNLPGGVIYQMMDKGMNNTWFSYISAFFTEMFEISVEEVMANPLPFYTSIYPEDQMKLVALYNGENVGKIDVEYRIRTKTKDCKWIHMRSSNHSSDNGIRIWDGFMIDITDRKLAEQELENTRRQQSILIKVLQIVQSAENLPMALNTSLAEIGKYIGVSRAYIFENSADGATISDTYEWCNEGISPTIDDMQDIPADFMNPWFDIFNNGDYICTSDIHTLVPEAVEILSGQGVKSIVVFPLSANGVNYGFVGFDDCLANRVWGEGEVGLLISLSQIISTTTRRHRAETTMRLSEEMYRQLTVASPDAIVVSNTEGNIRYVSPKALELFGMDENADVNDLRLRQFIHPHDLRQAYRMFEKLANDQVVFLPQILLVRNDKTEFFGEVSSATVKDADGHTTSVIMVIRDITQRKLSEMELIRAKEKAEESDKLKSAFLANMSHEIRTPINGIVGFLHFLGSDTLSPKRRQEYINVINNSSIQLVKLIDDIIDVAKIEAKQMNIRPVPFRMNDLMNELQVFFDTYLQANRKERIALILDDSQFIDSCITFVDPMRLRQVLNNLIGNAVKFTEKGFIRIAYRQSAPDQLEFVVEDSGIGLAPSQLEIIFERFRQAELSNSRQYGGTGLGLTISRSLVQLMGGDMRVESAEGSGSSFYFTISYLPVAPADESLFDETPPETTSPEGQLFKGKTVLVVEPEIMKFKYFEKMLSATGISVIRAVNLQQWLDYISQTNHIDSVIANASAIRNEAIEDIRKIKSVRAGLPVILMIPGQCTDYQQIIRDSQCNTALEEPVDYQGVLKALKRYVK